MSRSEIRFSGFGGQGIITAGYILGKAAALYDQYHVTLTKSYGPAFLDSLPGPTVEQGPMTALPAAAARWIDGE